MTSRATRVPGPIAAPPPRAPAVTHARHRAQEMACGRSRRRTPDRCHTPLLSPYAQRGGGSRHATQSGYSSIHTRRCTRQEDLCAGGERHPVDTIALLLTLVMTPGTEVARTLAVRLTALRVRTRGGPEGNVTPLAPLERTAERSWASEEAQGAWSEGQDIGRPGHGTCLHRFPPVLSRAGALLPADALHRQQV